VVTPEGGLHLYPSASEIRQNKGAPPIPCRRDKDGATTPDSLWRPLTKPDGFEGPLWRWVHADLCPATLIWARDKWPALVAGHRAVARNETVVGRSERRAGRVNARVAMRYGATRTRTS
jgi:hypothetical protein